MNKVRRSNFYMHSLTSEFCLKWGVFIKAATGHKDNFSKLRITQPEVKGDSTQYSKEEIKKNSLNLCATVLFKELLGQLWLMTWSAMPRVVKFVKQRGKQINLLQHQGILQLAACWNVYKWSKKPHLKFTKKRFPHHF